MSNKGTNLEAILNEYLNYKNFFNFDLSTLTFFSYFVISGGKGADSIALNTISAVLGYF